MVVATLLALRLFSSDPVEARLRSELGSLKGVEFTRDGETLQVKYRTEIVRAPRATKAAIPKKTETVAEERPTLTGFKLETYEFPHRATELARPEQAVRLNSGWLRDYGSWKMDSVERQVKGSDIGRYYYLAWGSKADPKLIARIRAVLERDTRPMKSNPQ